MSRLSYFRHLGVTVVALSPIFWNSKGEYHGFSTTDVSRIDPGFGRSPRKQSLILGTSIHIIYTINRLQ